MEIHFHGNLVVIPIPKAVLALTRDQFIECLRRGKAFRRAQQRQARVAPMDRIEHLSCECQPPSKGRKEVS